MDLFTKKPTATDQPNVMTPGGFGLNEKIEHFEEEENPLNVSMAQKKLKVEKKTSTTKSPNVKTSPKDGKDDAFKRQ